MISKISFLANLLNNLLDNLLDNLLHDLFMSVPLAGFVVESLTGKNATSDASDDSNPLMWSSSLTDGALLLDESSSEEST